MNEHFIEHQPGFPQIQDIYVTKPWGVVILLSFRSKKHSLGHDCRRNNLSSKDEIKLYPTGIKHFQLLLGVAVFETHTHICIDIVHIIYQHSIKHHMIYVYVAYDWAYSHCKDLLLPVLHCLKSKATPPPQKKTKTLQPPTQTFSQPFKHKKTIPPGSFTNPIIVLLENIQPTKNTGRLASWTTAPPLSSPAPPCSATAPPSGRRPQRHLPGRPGRLGSPLFGSFFGGAVAVVVVVVVAVVLALALVLLVVVVVVVVVVAAAADDDEAITQS